MGPGGGVRREGSPSQGAAIWLASENKADLCQPGIPEATLARRTPPLAAWNYRVGGAVTAPPEPPTLTRWVFTGSWPVLSTSSESWETTWLGHIPAWAPRRRLPRALSPVPHTRASGPPRPFLTWGQVSLGSSGSATTATQKRVSAPGSWKTLGPGEQVQPHSLQRSLPRASGQQLFCP